MQNEANVTYRARLDEIWTESKANIVRAFFQRTVSPNMNLAQLLEVLRFSEVQSQLDRVTLGDVVIQSTPVTQEPKPELRVASGKAPARKPRRLRRGARQVQAIKDALLARVQTSAGGTSVKHLVSVLNKDGMSVDVVLVGRLLKELFNDGVLDCSRGKPNIWRGRVQGRRVPEPMIIRKGRQES